MSLSLRVLLYVVNASSQTSTAQTNAIREQARASCNWKMLYHELLGDDRIWDLRDLLTAMIPVFGIEDTFSQLLGMSSTPQSLQVLVDDWIHPEYDESATLGLLDTFSSLILQNVTDHSRNSLLLHHSRGLAESIQQHNTQQVKTRPFVQFILARAAVEIDQVWKERARGLSLPDGLPVVSDSGVNLPIFVPAKHLEKPGWERFHAPTPPSLQQAVNIALQAAKLNGDYALQATAWKLLILQSEEPKPMMDGLARLQLDLQDDKEGFLATCLSKYLTTLETEEEDDLLKELGRLDEASGGTYLTWGFNASLLWARSIIQGHLESSIRGPIDEISGAMQDPGKVCRDEIDGYGTRLSERVVRFLDRAFNITAPRPLRVSFDELLDRGQAQAATPTGSPQQQESHSSRQGPVPRVDDSSTSKKEKLRDPNANVKLDTRIRNTRHSERSVSPMRFENHLGHARPRSYYQPGKTVVTIDGEGRTVVTVRNEGDFSDDYGEGDSSDDYGEGPEHRTSDPDTDEDVDIMVRDQYSEAKNARRTVRQTENWQLQDRQSEDWDEVSFGDQWPPSSDDDDDDMRVYTHINPRRSDRDVLGHRLGPTRFSSRPDTNYGPNYLRAESPSRHHRSRLLEIELERRRQWERQREWERQRHSERVGSNYFHSESPWRRHRARLLETELERRRQWDRERELERHRRRERERERMFYSDAAFARDSPPSYPPAFQGGYPTHVEGIRQPVRTFPPHPSAPYGSFPPPPGGVSPPPVHPPGTYYGPPHPPQQPGYFPVSGWPATWQQDANRLLGPTDPQPQPFAQPPPALLLERGAHQEKGGYPPQGIVSSADDEFRHDRLDTQRFASLTPVAEERGRTVEAAAVKEAEADGEKGSTPTVAANDDAEDEEGDDGDEELPRSSVQDGLPKLNFPPKILDDNTMTVVVRSKADPQKGKMYTISKEEGVKEADVPKLAGYSHQDASYPRQDAVYPHQDAVYPHHESSGVRRHSPSIRRRISYRDTSLPRHEPLTHGPVRAVPDAPPPPRADPSAAKAKEPSGAQETEGSRKTTDKKTTADPEARQHRRQHSMTKADGPKNSAKPGAPDRNPISGTFVGSPRRMHTKDRYTSPAAASPSRAGTKDQRVPRVRERPRTGKPGPEQGAKNKNQAYAETDGESDARPDSPVDNSGVGSEAKAVPPGTQQDEEDKMSVTAQRGGSERGDGGKEIARAQTWHM